MPLNRSNAIIDLRKSDPRLIYNINNAPRPEDDFLNYRLGQEYDHYTKLRRDGHLNSKLQKRVDSVLGRRIVIESENWDIFNEVEEVDEFGEEGKEIPEEVQLLKTLLKKVNYELLCKDLKDSGNLLGFCGVKVDWHLDPLTEILYPTFEFIPQYRFNFAYHDESPTAARLMTDERLSQQLPVKDQIVMSRGYEVRLLTKRSPLTGERIPKGRLILYSFGSSQGLPWGCGLGYQLYPLIQVKNESRNAWLLHSDRLGSPPVLGTYPFNNTPKDSSAPPNVFDLRNPNHKRIKEQFEDYLAAISPNGFGVFPEGFDAKLLEAINSSNPDVHERLIRFCDHQVSETILGEIAYSERQSGGSRAASDTQVEDRDRNLTDSDCNLLDEQLIDFWDYFWFLNAPEGMVRPVIRRWTTEDDRKLEERKKKQEAKKLKLETRKLRAEADNILITAGLEPSRDYVEKHYPGWKFLPKPKVVASLPSVNLDPQSTALAQAEEPKAALPPAKVDQSEWTRKRRQKLENGDLLGGFAGPLNSYPVSTSVDLERVYEMSEFSDLKNKVRFNAVNICNRFSIPLTPSFSSWAEEHIQGDFAGVSRYVSWNGYKIGVEYEVGSTRFDRPMKIAYGHFTNHIGADNEALDVYIGPHFSSEKIFRITQLDQDGNFDEFKYGILFDSIEKFEAAYKRQMPSKLFGGIEECDRFEIDSHHRLNFDDKDAGVYGVFWANRATGSIVNANSFSEAKEKARALESYGAIQGVRKLKGADAIKLRCGAWARIEPSNKWLFTDSTSIKIIERKMPDKNRVESNDFFEPIILIDDTQTLTDRELDDFANDREAAEQDARIEWEENAPSEFKGILNEYS
jgi:hypothetical protein